ncbi:hypothetical protein [Asanoa iriomotensis]|uniref:Uncharacterized protein n=1 Tax=Asanoa iriomotensis TaxID=234613 RepID=A0ABQ4C5N4_9ACTN|nr:hypothetical protein [Asanoa iriomotensis]GIF58074.1 hypothetical protein Air01nite_41690 [Asanoa iriomotensis]
MRSLIIGLVPLSIVVTALAAVHLWSGDAGRRRRAMDLLRLLLRR